MLGRRHRAGGLVAKLAKATHHLGDAAGRKITETTIDALAKLMQADDVIIDGGNTFWQDDVRRGKALKERGIHYIDVGTSGASGASIAATA